MSNEAKRSEQEQSQQEFLRAAMKEVGMSRQAFAELLEVPWDTFRRWTLADGSGGEREMQPTAWSLVRKTVAYEKLRLKYDKLKNAHDKLKQEK